MFATDAASCSKLMLSWMRLSNKSDWALTSQRVREASRNPCPAH